MSVLNDRSWLPRKLRRAGYELVRVGHHYKVYDTDGNYRATIYSEQASTSTRNRLNSSLTCIRQGLLPDPRLGKGDKP